MVITIPCTKDFERILHDAVSSLDGQSVHIRFDSGRYFFTQPVRLGKQAQNITFSGNPDTRLIGGVLLADWYPLEGQPEAGRFDPSAVPHLVVCDLQQAGVADLGGYLSRGFGRYAQTGHAELFADGAPMTLSQYPKGEAFLRIDSVGDTTEDEWGEHDGVLEQGFVINDARVRSWLSAPDIQAMGYWKYDWASSVETVASINSDTGHIMTQPPYGNYGFRKGQRVRFYHITQEVLAPGDYYIDYQARKAYMYPLPGAKEIILSTMTEPLFDLDHSQHITIRDLSLEALRGSAISGYHALHLTVDNCTIKNVGNHALDLCQCNHARIVNNTIHDCGDCGVLAMAGNRITLESSDTLIHNNHIHHFAKWGLCYVTAVRVIGVGFQITHNLIHDCPHTAILYDGNEMTIEYNEIYNAVLETGDAGAIYSGRDFTCRGNSVSHNFIHHLGGVGFGAMGIYNDDCLSGTKMHGNYFLELTRACMLGGGRDFSVQGNVFVKCDPAISFDSRGAALHPRWISGINASLRPIFYSIRRFSAHHWPTQRYAQEVESYKDEVTSATQEPYRSRYPDLLYIDNAYRTQPFGRVKIPASADVAYNVFCSKLRFRYHEDEATNTLYDNGTPVENSRRLRAYAFDPTRDINQTIAAGLGDLRTRANYTASPEDFVDAAWGDIRIKPDSNAFHYDYVDGCLENIGLKPELRRNNPPTVRSRLSPEGLYMRNESSQQVQGRMMLLADPGVAVDKSSVDFDLAAGEEVFYPLAITTTVDEPKLTARSHTPGVRPCRL